MSEVLDTGRPFGLIVIAALAFTQGVLGILRAFEWFRIGIDLSRRGVLILPFLGALTFARGALVVALALLYILAALGAFLGRGWAWWLGLAVSVLNGLGVLGLLIEGESVARSLFWAIVPIILIWYLLSPAGRQVLRG